METVRVFVGVDRSQLLAVKVLEHSIKRHSSLPVEVVAMCDLPVPQPKDPRQSQRTGFSFSRFCIPRLAGYQGRAIYMDADMLVFKDIRELWEMDFKGSKVIIQEELTANQSSTAGKLNGPSKRKKQCAVMLLDCGRLDWRIEDIVRGLDDEDYDYSQLMDLCILKDEEIRYDLPFRWNSLEHYDVSTCLIHYTDMMTQPWVSPFNKHANVWYDEVRLMLKNGTLTEGEIQAEIDAGYFRPSLLRDLKADHLVPRALKYPYNQWNFLRDKAKGYVPHSEVRKIKSIREKAIKDYEQANQTKHL